MRDFIKQYIETTKNKKFECERCKGRYVTKKELEEHRINQHGEYPASYHKKVKPSTIHTIYNKYYGGNKKQRKLKPFDPKKVYDKVREGKLPSHKCYIDQMIVKDTNQAIEIMYIWDKDRKLYRIYTNDLKYGDFIELVFDNKLQRYRPNNYQSLKDNWIKQPVKVCKEHVIEEFGDIKV